MIPNHILSLNPSIKFNKEKNIRLLNVSGCGTRNIKALSSVMDLQSVKIRCLLSEIDAWNNICKESDIIETLQFRWDPQCDSLSESKVKDFFEHLFEHDENIENISLDFFHGEIKQMSNAQIISDLYPQIENFKDCVAKCIEKKGLKSLSIKLQRVDPYEVTKNDFPSIVVQKMVDVFREVSNKLQLTELNLEMDLGQVVNTLIEEINDCIFLGTHELETLVSSLISVTSLKKLSLKKISSEFGGFESLALMIKQVF